MRWRALEFSGKLESSKYIYIYIYIYSVLNQEITCLLWKNWKTLKIEFDDD